MVSNIPFSSVTVRSWLGKVELRFSLQKKKNVLTKCQHVGPFIVQRSFYSEEDKNVPHVYLLHSAGGLVGGDKLVLDVRLDPGSQALLTTASASKFYRTNGLYAYQKNIFKLAKNTILEWVPQNNIFFPKSKVIIDTTFILASGARVIAFEMFCFNIVMLDFNVEGPEEINISSRIDLPHSIGLRDRLQLNSFDYARKLGGFKISALFFASPLNKKVLFQVRTLIEKECVNNDFQIGGATLLGELLVVRLLGNDNQKLQVLLYLLWSIIRPVVVGKDVMRPRIWYT